jgi:hypothetical protein
MHERLPRELRDMVNHELREDCEELEGIGELCISTRSGDNADEDGPEAFGYAHHIDGCGGFESRNSV